MQLLFLIDCLLLLLCTSTSASNGKVSAIEVRNHNQRRAPGGLAPSAATPPPTHANFMKPYPPGGGVPKPRISGSATIPERAVAMNMVVTPQATTTDAPAILSSGTIKLIGVVLVLEVGAVVVAGLGYCFIRRRRSRKIEALQFGHKPGPFDA